MGQVTTGLLTSIRQTLRPRPLNRDVTAMLFGIGCGIVYLMFF